MFIILIDNNIVIKKTIQDSYTYLGIKIYKKKDNYYICLNNNYLFLDDTKQKRLLCGSYEIKNELNYVRIYLYAYENDDGINEFSLYKKTDLLISRDPNSNIVSLDDNLKNTYLYIKNGILKTNSPCLLINNKHYDSKKLAENDVIDFIGHKVIYFDNFLYINNFKCINTLKRYQISRNLVSYNKDAIEDIGPIIVKRKEDVFLDDIRPFNDRKEIEHIYKSLIPNIIMSLFMFLSSYMNYQNNIKTNEEIMILPYLIMPISMFVSGIVLPVIFYLASLINNEVNFHKYKKEYLKYLNDYEKYLIEKINSYLNYHNQFYFDEQNYKQKLFYSYKTRLDYMCLSIGKISTSMSLKYKECSDKDINAYYDKLNCIANNINNYPLLLDLKKNRNVSFVLNNSNYEYIFNSVLLELLLKHHYEDIKIAIYSKNKYFLSLNTFPHSLLNNQRLYFSDEQSLSNLDYIYLDKPLIILQLDKCNYEFNNPNITTILFTKDETDIKNFDCVVYYYNNEGVMLNTNITKFNYIQKSVNFSSYYSRISKYAIFNSSYSLKYKDLGVNILDNYEKNHSGLLASFSYDANGPIDFDLDESKYGPHGLIGGATGSGKSELLISLLFSLCLRYSPSYLNIVLIDYKGGGIKESLSYKDKTIPHIVSSLSNLDKGLFERLIISLKNECLKRELLFKKLSKQVHNPIANINEYINSKDEKFPNMAHLIIAVDEFAELKKENPHLIQELISISRIGRSLGVHLILATQKPGGTIDDEIFSNSHFKIALKVFEDKDSLDLLKTKEAVYLNNPGEFILKVDNLSIKGKSIYTKNDIYENEPYVVSSLNDDLSVINRYSITKGKRRSEINYYCEKIIEISKDRYVQNAIDYLPPSSSERKKGSYAGYYLVGIIDDYINDNNDCLKYRIDENILVVSNRENEINSYLNTLNENKVQSIVIAKTYCKGGYIKQSLKYSDEEYIDYVFNYFLNNNPNLVLVIEDLNCLISYKDEYQSFIYKLVSRSNSNYHLVIINTTSQISFKMLNSVNNKILINVNDASDISAIFNCRSNYKGSSYFYKDGAITFVPNRIEEYMYTETKVDSLISKMPLMIKPKIYQGSCLLGYEYISNKEIYANNNTIVISYSKKLIEHYQKSYHNTINCQLYTKNMVIDYKANYLWLGSGVFYQQVIATNLKEDLNDNEGIYSVNGKIIKIRCLDYE